MPICHENDIPEGEGRSFFLSGHNPPVMKILIVKKNNQLYAYEDRCAHFGIPLGVTEGYTYIEDGMITCQVHRARYAVEDGHCIRGDCDGDGLKPLSISKNNGWIEITKSQ